MPFDDITAPPTLSRRAILAYAGVAVLFAVLLVAFGYLDEDLDEARRWGGGGLIVAGLAIAVPAVRRLASDWPRLKPRHNVDLAFLQIALAVVVLCLACLLGGRPEAALAPLFKPTPTVTAPPDEAR